MYDFLLVTNSNFGPATVFEILKHKSRKSLNFLTHPSLRPSSGKSLEFGDKIWRQKTRILGLPDGEEIMTISFFVLTQYRRVTDGQTDGQTDKTDTLRSLLPALA